MMEVTHYDLSNTLSDAQRYTDEKARDLEYYVDDTSFNCFPSLHAAVSTMIFYCWYRYSKIEHDNPKAPPKWLRQILAISTFVIAILVMLSTLFVKQHYIVDEIAGFILAIGVGKLVYDYLWKE